MKTEPKSSRLSMGGQTGLFRDAIALGLLSAYRKYIQAATASKITAKIQRDVSLIPVFLAIGAYLKPKMEQN
jgi:hypothetical protein